MQKSGVKGKSIVLIAANSLFRRFDHSGRDTYSVVTIWFHNVALSLFISMQNC
jgi:hypothetical protein